MKIFNIDGSCAATENKSLLVKQNKMINFLTGLEQLAVSELQHDEYKYQHLMVLEIWNDTILLYSVQDQT